MYRIVLLGGGGFIGNALARALVKTGEAVLVLNRTGQNRVPGAQSQGVDRGQPDDVCAALKRFNADIIIDLIAYEEQQTLALLDLLSGQVWRYVLVSSCDVYAAFGRLLGTEGGKVDHKPLCENAPLRTNLYPFRGLMGDRHWYDKIPLEQAVLDTPHMDSVVMRLPMVFGPDDPRQRYQELTEVLERGGNTITMEDKFANWVSPHLHVDDVGRAIAMAACHPDTGGQVFNVGPDRHYSERQRAQVFARANGQYLHVKTNPAGPDEQDDNYDQNIILNSSHLRNVTGWAPQLSQDEAFQSVWAWRYRQRTP